MNLTSLIQTYGFGTVDTSVPTKPGLAYSFAVTYVVFIWVCVSMILSCPCYDGLWTAALHACQW